MARRQFTITVSPELGRYLEERSVEVGINKSALVSRALEADRELYLERLLEEGYAETAGHDQELLEEFEGMDKDSPWPEY